MDGIMYNVLSSLHRRKKDCSCIQGNVDCKKCEAIMAALSELEKVPEWQAMSVALENSIEAQE